MLTLPHVITVRLWGLHRRDPLWRGAGDSPLIPNGFCTATQVMPKAIPTKSDRHDAMGRLIVKLGKALAGDDFKSARELKLIGNGAATKDGGLGPITLIDAVRSALTAGCLTEQIYCDETGKRRSKPDSDRISGMDQFPPHKRWLVEMSGSEKDIKYAVESARSEHMRLFIAKNGNYDALGQLINPDNFRVIYGKVGKKAGAGVGDLIIDDTEMDSLSTDPAGMPRRAWLYVCIGEVEEEDVRPKVFNAAKKAGLIGKKNSVDPTGNTNVRYWAPDWAQIILAEMKRCYDRNKNKQFIAGFMLDVCDSWARPDSSWSP